MFSERNHDVAHSPDQDAEDWVYDWDIVKDFITEGTEKEQDDANKALTDALRRFKESVYKFAKENDILLSEAEGAAKEWFDDLWNETFEVGF